MIGFKKKSKIRGLKDYSYILVKRSQSEKVIFGIVFVLFCAYAVTLLFPFLWLLVKSFEDPIFYDVNIMINGPFGIPEKFVFNNYIDAFTKMTYNEVSFVGMIFNSLWYIALGLTWAMIWPVCVGYVFAKYNFKGKEFIYALAIFSMTVPIIGSGGAYYRFIAFFKLYDSGPLFDLVTGTAGFGSGMLILYGAFKSISWSYAEAVFIDGGSNYTAFFKVMLPQAMPIITAMMITNGIGLWNEYYSRMMYNPSYPTVATGLYFISLTIDRFGKPLYFAGLIISLIPVLLVFTAFSDKMLKSLSIGGLKG